MKWLYGVQTGEWGRSVQPSGKGKAIHCPNEKFALLQLFAGVKKQKQRMFDLGQIDVVSQSMSRQNDSYVSQATFVGSSRRKTHFSRVRACWVDLDIQDQGRMLDSALVSEIRQHCDQLGLPQPSLIVSSGRGAYLKWVLERSVTDLPAWEAAQSMLVLLFQPFAADKLARDASRVFRILGSHNSKVEDQVQREVRAIEGTGREVLFETLAIALEHARGQITLPQVLLQSGAVAPRRPRSATLDRWGERLLHAAEHGSIDDLKLFARLREPILQGNKLSTASLGWARFCDLRDLYISRGGIPVGQRDLSMLWMINSLGHAGIVTPQNFDSEVSGLLRAFPQGQDRYEPLQDGSLQTLRQRLFKTHALRQDIASGKIDAHTTYIDASELLYRPGNQFLIETFDISENEQKPLKTLISSQEKLRRADAKAPGRAERREQRNALKARVQQWIQEHGGVCENISALARELGEAVCRVWRVVKALHKAIQSGAPKPDPKPAENPAMPAKPVSAHKEKTPKPSGPKSWMALARDFALFVASKKGAGSTMQAPRSILGSYGSRHDQSLAALRQAAARPRKAGFKHWMSAFTKDISDFYRAHGAWPSDEQRQSLMAWHKSTFAALWKQDSAQRPTPKAGPMGDSKSAPAAEKPEFLTELSVKLTQNKEYIPTKTLFVTYYGEEGARRWESMGSVDRLRASIQMEQDIWQQARQTAKSSVDSIRERWQSMVQKDRATIEAAASKREQKLGNAIGSLVNVWQRKRSWRTQQEDLKCFGAAVP